MACCSCKGGCCKNCDCKQCLKTNALLIATLLGVACGIGMGVGLRYLDPPMTTREIHYLQFPGEIMMRMLMCLIVPLVVSSLIAGIAHLKAPGRMGLRTVVYYMCTTVIAVLLGLIMVTSIQPGNYGEKDEDSTSEEYESQHPVDAILDLIRNMFPDNMVTTCFEMARTLEDIVETNTTTANSTNITVEEESIPVPGTHRAINILGLVALSLSFGIVIGRMEEKGKPLLDFFDSLNEATIILITVVIWYTPIGVCFLIAAKLVEVDDLEELMAQIGAYLVTVISGLLIHGIIILPLIYLAITRKNPITYCIGALQALLTAFATASSSATLPVTFRCLEENLHMDRRVTRFVLPIGATINMDGTALYEAVGAVFIAQLNDIELDWVDYIVMSVTATLVSIGAAGVPNAGVMTMVIVLAAVGLPTDDISLLLAVDWLVDRVRTMINVWGDSIGTGVVAHLSRKELEDNESSTSSETSSNVSDDLAKSYIHCLEYESPSKEKRDDLSDEEFSVTIVSGGADWDYDVEAPTKSSVCLDDIALVEKHSDEKGLIGGDETAVEMNGLVGQVNIAVEVNELVGQDNIAFEVNGLVGQDNIAFEDETRSDTQL